MRRGVSLQEPTYPWIVDARFVMIERCQRQRHNDRPAMNLHTPRRADRPNTRRSLRSCRRWWSATGQADRSSRIGEPVTFRSRMSAIKRSPAVAGTITGGNLILGVARSRGPRSRRFRDGVALCALRPSADSALRRTTKWRSVSRRRISKLAFPGLVVRHEDLWH